MASLIPGGEAASFITSYHILLTCLICLHSTLNQKHTKPNAIPQSSQTCCITLTAILLLVHRSSKCSKPKSGFRSEQLGHMRVTASAELVQASFCNKNGLICCSQGKSSQTSPGPRCRLIPLIRYLETSQRLESLSPTDPRKMHFSVSLDSK